MLGEFGPIVGTEPWTSNYILRYISQSLHGSMLSLILDMKSAETFHGCGQREQQRQGGEARRLRSELLKPLLADWQSQLQGNTGCDDFVVQKWGLENLIMDQYHELFAQIQLSLEFPSQTNFKRFFKSDRAPLWKSEHFRRYFFPHSLVFYAIEILITHHTIWGKTE